MGHHRADEGPNAIGANQSSGGILDMTALMLGHYCYAMRVQRKLDNILSARKLNERAGIGSIEENLEKIGSMDRSIGRAIPACEPRTERHLDYPVSTPGTDVHSIRCGAQPVNCVAKAQSFEDPARIGCQLKARASLLKLYRSF